MQIKQKIKGSILAYALIILSMMFVIVGAISVATVFEKQDAVSSDSSTQALQVADSGAQWGVMQINNLLYSNNTNSASNKISDAFSDCANSSGVAEVKTVKYGLTFDLIFYDSNHNLINNCSQNASNIKSIKSTGSYKNTIRAMEVAVLPVTSSTTSTSTSSSTTSTSTSCNSSSLTNYTTGLAATYSDGQVVENDQAGGGYTNSYCYKCQSGSWNMCNNDGSSGSGSYNYWVEGCSLGC